MTVSILLATTGRPKMAAACVQGIWATTEGHDVQIVAAVDKDSVTATTLEDMGCVVDHADDYRGCSKAWNDALSRATGDPLVLAADDLTWGQGWLDAALERLSQFEDGWGLVGFNDGHWNADLSTHYLMSRRLVVEVLGGVVAWEFYSHSFNDVEATERAKRAGRYAWAEDAHVHHRHWIFGERPQDETDARNLPEWSNSSEVYRSREAAGFPNNFEAVITC